MYTVKGYIEIDGKTRHVTILTEATSCMDAIARATDECHLKDVTAVALSPVKEVVHEVHSDDCDYFIATAKTMPTEEGEKALSYQLLVCALDFESAQRTIKEHLTQGYDMELSALKQTKIFSVIE